MSYSSEVLADSPVGYWRLDDTSGTTMVDSSGNSRNGTYDSGTSLAQTSLLPVDGGTSVHFDSTHHGTVASNSAFNISSTSATFTLEFWVKIDSPTSTTLQVVIDKTDLSTSNRQWVVYWDNRGGASLTDSLVFRYDGNTGAGPAGCIIWSGTTARSAVAAGGHFVGVVEASTVRLYWNGSEVLNESREASAINSSNGNTIGFGRRSTTTGSYLTGTLDEVAIYQSALSSTRVAAHYNAATGSVSGSVAATLPSLTAAVAGDVTIPGTVAATLPSLTASVAGLSIDTGSVAATLPALTAAIAGTADDTSYGVVGATLPALSASVAGVVTIAGSVAATLPALTASIAGTGPVGDSVLATLPALSAAIAGTSTPDVVEISMDTHGAGTIDVTDLTPVVPLSMAMHGAGRVNMRLPRDWNADPRTGRPQWKFVLADMPTLGGALKCQLEVVSDDIEESLDEMTSGAFSIRTRDPKRDLIEPVTTWLHAYRGTVHMGGGPILPNPSENGATTTYQWRDPRWYLDGDFRPIKQIPRRDLLLNPEFDQGLLYWQGGFDPGTIPAVAPITAVIDSEFEPGGKAMQITGADKTQLVTQEAKTGAVFVPNEATYLSGGEAVIQGIGANIPNGSAVQITGYTANDGTGSGLTLSHNRALAAKATLSAMGKGFTFTQPSTASYAPGTFVTGGNVVGRGYYSPIAGGLAANRRVVIAYEGVQTALGSAQWRKQTVRVTAETQRKVRLSPVGEFKITDWIGPNLPGLAAKVTVVKVGETAPIEGGTATVEMTEETPRDRLMSTTELEGNLEVEIPAGTAQYDVTLYLYAPAGKIAWENAHLYPDDGLYFYGVDQALIVKTILEHGQDPAKGWADLGFTTRTPLTGVPRRRPYPYWAQRPTLVALTEFTALDRGMDISCEVTPTGATIVTHYPRQGTTADLVLAHGYNVVAWEAATSREVASLIIAQADGSGIARPEQYAWDDTALGGLRLAGIVNAENETPLNELDEFAVRELARAKVTTPAYWVTIHPRFVSDVYDRANMGDSLRFSCSAFDGAVRLVKRTPDPNTDGLRVMLAVEV